MRVAVYGDSFTRGAGEDRQADWAATMDPRVESLVTRLRALHPDAVVHNGAEDGARWRDLRSQMERGPAGATHVVIMLGLNDLCDPGLALGALNSEVQRGMAAIDEAHPGADVTVLAVVDLTAYRSLHHSIPEARALWSGIDACRDALDPRASAQTVAQAKAWGKAVNAVLKAATGGHGHSFSDATVWPGFTAGELWRSDYFHPNVWGERRLAAIVWREVEPRFVSQSGM